MHFSIPDLQQFHDDNGISYTAYNIYIDGFFHCSARYKQLLSLHEQLQAQNPYYKLPQFPPKKLFLTSSQLEERRILLEKYIQTVGQTPVLANSELLITFLFSAQQETHSVRMHKVDIEISLMNGYRIPLSVSSIDSSSTILDIACNNINLPRELVKYFSLYLFNWSCAKDGEPSLKKLEDYESPYISQKYVRPEDKIVLRKSYWDPCYDVDLMIDKVSLDLLYLQTIEELDLGWIVADSQSKEILTSYEMNKQKREYLELAKTMRHYGRIPAGEAVTDSANIVGGVSETTCRVRVSLASKELTLTSVTHPSREHRFKVTRMRCWRITTLHCMEKQQANGSLPDDSNKNFELSFEYLISKDNLKWITLRTEHATFISVCLQSIVDELMRQKAGIGPESPKCGKRGSLTYLRRDGSSQLITPSSSSDTLSSSNGDSYNSGSSKEIFSVQRLTEKFASVAFKSGKDCVENNAFEAIGDEEL